MSSIEGREKIELEKVLVKAERFRAERFRTKIEEKKWKSERESNVERSEWSSFDKTERDGHYEWCGFSFYSFSFSLLSMFHVLSFFHVDSFSSGRKMPAKKNFKRKLNRSSTHRWLFKRKRNHQNKHKHTLRVINALVSIMKWTFTKSVFIKVWNMPSS